MYICICTHRSPVITPLLLFLQVEVWVGPGGEGRTKTSGTLGEWTAGKTFQGDCNIPSACCIITAVVQMMCVCVSDSVKISNRAKLCIVVKVVP